MVFSAEVYSKVLKRKIRVVVLRQCEGDKLTSQTALFTTDLNLPPMTVVEYYKARFQIEFVFRNAKQHIAIVKNNAVLSRISAMAMCLF
jgi:hypothetical protein